MAHGGLRLREAAKLGFDRGFGPVDVKGAGSALTYDGLGQLANLVDRIIGNS